MVALIQSLKVLFLIFTTIITVYYFIKDYKIGFKYYLFFVILSGLLGFVRPIFAEEIILPIIIPLGVYTYYKRFNTTKISYISLFILVYGVLMTLINKDASFTGNDTYFIFGFVILAFSNYLFGNEKSSINTFALLWLYVLARTIWLITYGGSNVFLLSDLSEGGSRLLEFEAGLDNSTGKVRLDPNYLGFTMGFGFLLSLLFLINRKNLYKHLQFKFIRKKWFLAVVVIIGLMEFWLSIRGLSRGVILAILAAILTFLFLNKKIKTFAVTAILLVVSFVVFNDVINLFLLRFSEDNTGSGRYDMWESIWKLMISEGRILTGFGLNYPWWGSWEVGRHVYASTHNSWITILLSVGLIGLILLFVYISISLKNNYKANTTTSKIRIVMFAYLFVACFSIEPLMNSFGWIILAVSTSFDSKISIIVKKWIKTRN
ncbi:MAG: O-antigen ligase family protein [Brumimicrobium sp.]|nr:O-antigen ligase family protein [Brumimicrobium sp.]